MIEIVIVAAICLAAVAAVGYFLYTRISSRDKSVEELVRRYKSLESIITRPHPIQEAYSVINGPKEMPMEEKYIQRRHQPPPPRHTRQRVYFDDEEEPGENTKDDISQSCMRPQQKHQQQDVDDAPELCDTCTIEPIDINSVAANKQNSSSINTESS